MSWVFAFICLERVKQSKNATKKWRRSMVYINAIYFIICTALAMADSSPAGFLPPAVA